MLETELCEKRTEGYQLKADMIPPLNLLILIKTNRSFADVEKKFLRSGFKKTGKSNGLSGTAKIGKTTFPAAIDFTDGLREKTAMDGDHDSSFPMKIAINLDYSTIEEPTKEKLTRLVKGFVNGYGITKLLGKAEKVTWK